MVIIYRTGFFVNRDELFYFNGRRIIHDVIHFNYPTHIRCPRCGETMRLVGTVIRSAEIFVNKSINKSEDLWDMIRLNSSEYLQLTPEELDEITLEVVYFRIPVYLCDVCMGTAWRDGKKLHTYYHRMLPYFLQPDWVQCLKLVIMVARKQEPPWMWISYKRRRHARARIEHLKTYRIRELNSTRKANIWTGWDGKHNLMTWLQYNIYAVLHILGFYSIAGVYTVHWRRPTIR